MRDWPQESHCSTLAAERGGAADLDGAHHAQVVTRQTMTLPVGGSVLAKDVGQFQSGPVHRRGTTWVGP